MNKYILLGVVILSLSLNQLTAQTFHGCYPSNPSTSVASACLWSNATSNNTTFNTTTGSAVKFDRRNDLPSWRSFYFFDDGYFSLNSDPNHVFRVTNPGNTQFNVEARSGDDYKESLPARFGGPGGVGFIPITAPNLGLAPPSLRTRNTVDIRTSWAPADDEEYIYIIAFTHPNTAMTAGQPVSGTIKFNAPSPLLSSITVKTPSNRPGNWASVGIPTNNGLLWHFNNLQPGEVRYLYVTAQVSPGTSRGSLINSSVDVDYIVDSTGYMGTYNGTHQTSVRTPKDPNSIDVDFIIASGNHQDKQQLRYDVQFYNNGDDFIKDVYVDVELDPTQHIIPTVNMINSSSTCTGITFPTPEIVRFHFDNIYLAGTEQQPCPPGTVTLPNVPPCDQIFGWEDVSATFSFSVCTSENLPYGQVEASMEVTFVGVGSLAGEEPAITSLETGIIAPPCGTTYDDQQDYTFTPGDGEDEEGGDGDPNERAEGITKNSKVNDGRTATFKQPAAYPNPFNDFFMVPFEVTSSSATKISIRLFNATGQELGTIYEGNQFPGRYMHRFDAHNLEAGVYFLHLQNGEEYSTQRIVKLR